MIDKRNICSKYLEIVGRPICYVDKNAREIEFYGVIQPTWRRNKTRFDDTKTKIGRVRNDYYMYLGPSNIDIYALPEEKIFFCDGEGYEFVKKEKVVIGGVLQFYSGVLHKLEEEQYGYFE